MKSLFKFRVNLELFLFKKNNYRVKYFRVTVNCSLIVENDFMIVSVKSVA